MDEFDLEGGGLDLSGLLGSPLAAPQQAAPPMAQQSQQSQHGGGWKDFGPIAALIPLAAARGGPSAVAALIAGFQQRKMQGQQLDRQQRIDQRADQQQSDLQQYRNSQIENTRRQQRLAFLRQAQTGVEDIEDPDMLARYREAMTVAGQGFGVDASAIEAITNIPVTRLQKRAAEKRIAALKSQHGDKWMEMGGRFLHELPGGERVPFEELQRRAGYVADPNAPAQAPTSEIVPDVPLDRQHAMAVAAGNEALAKKIEEAMRRQDSAKSQPVDPQLASLNRQIAEVRLATLQSAQQAGRSPRDVTVFNQLAGAFERSPLTKAKDRTIVLEDAIKAIEQNPRDPSSQMQLAYSYIQALDTYQSAVREGELQNLGALGTRWQQLATAINRVAFEGAFMPPEVARNVSINARRIIAAIKAGADKKQQEFASRAQVSGVGDMWAEFIVGATGAPARVGGGGISRPSSGNPYGGGRAR
jgi:hypothetical protein